MRFVRDLSEAEYKEFYKNNKASFLQSWQWGEFCKIGKGQKAVHVGIKDDKGNIICAALLLKTSLPLGFSYFYAPRGFIIDFNNKELLKYFTLELKKFMKEKKAIYLKIDPEISYQELDNDANPISKGKNNFKLHEYMKSIGYTHGGFNKLYEKNQPRYTFIINLEEDFISKMSKSFLKNIDKAKKYDLEFVIGDESNLEDFTLLYQKTKDRAGFSGYDLDYYKNVFSVFYKEKMAKLFLVKIYPVKILNNLKEELKVHKNELSVIKNENKKILLHKSIERITNEITFFEKYKDCKDGLFISAHIMVFAGNTTTALYAGSDKDFMSTYANNFMYFEKIKYAKDKGYKYLDLFGVAGDPKTNFKNLAGIYEFKKGLGGNLIEFLGEYDLIANKFMHAFIKIAIPLQRKVKKMLKRR